MQKKASVLKALRALVVLTSLPLIVLYLASQWYSGLQDSQIPLPSSETDHDVNQTIWEILSKDESVSRFTQIVGELPNIVKALSTPQARFTIYAPVNEAFDSFYFPPDPPPFFGLFIAGCHMGPELVPAERLRSMSTVTSFVNGDIFFTYKQRISVQQYGGQIRLNHEAEVLPRESLQSTAVNGFIHHIGSVLVLPNSTAHALRTRPQLSKFHQGLASTRLADDIYDTNAHVSQTMFAPTNAAFDRLGRKVSKFLFSHGGKPYLRALLEYHVVANRTLYSDNYWPHGGAELVNFDNSETPNFHKFNLPTMHPNLTLGVESQKVHNKWRLNVLSGGSVEDPKQHDTIHVSVHDIITMDGVIHLIDSLILPPSPAKERKLHWLNKLVSVFWHQEQSVEALMDLLEPYVNEEAFV
ncbi:hypothetical protein FZEAL_7862 [Fusarium zealandicum]|uniref:FAS1 domain-containing protein n=1 Tax=Fusarium zealandicum TaxID=1053134 RepID=A0A8H4XIF4_9HYPO|nr:hypothetical protein FZEAL_7862 [Fusarium zealandicum]